MKPYPSWGAEEVGCPIPPGVFPELNRVEEGLHATPRRRSPDCPGFSPVCLYGLTGRGSYRVVGFSDIGVSGYFRGFVFFFFFKFFVIGVLRYGV